jgi:hypothetical protein
MLSARDRESLRSVPFSMATSLSGGFQEPSSTGRYWPVRARRLTSAPTPKRQVGIRKSGRSTAAMMGWAPSLVAQMLLKPFKLRCEELHMLWSVVCIEVTTRDHDKLLWLASS